MTQRDRHSLRFRKTRGPCWGRGRLKVVGPAGKVTGCLWQLGGLQGQNLERQAYLIWAWVRGLRQMPAAFAGPATRRWRSNRGICSTNEGAGKKSGGHNGASMEPWCGAAGTAGGRDQTDDDDDEGEYEEEEWLEALALSFLLSGCIWSGENVASNHMDPSPPLMAEGALEPITAVLGWGRGYTPLRLAS